MEFLIISLIKIVVVLIIILTTVANLVWAERRISAYIQDRIGPNRVGPFGLFQAPADVLKLFLKEEIVPARANPFVHTLAPIISIKVVASVDDAIAHINRSGSHHTDAILTNHHPSAMRFLREVDSSSVMINASTRFADGFEYGLGAEIGISTDKFHARGPVGLEGLTSLKFVVLGQGEVRS